jgi:hypothetical protein
VRCRSGPWGWRDRSVGVARWKQHDLQACPCICRQSRRSVACPTPPHLELELLRGSLITLRRRCGKPNCQSSATGEPHQTRRCRSCTTAAPDQIVTLCEDDLDEVAAALGRYRLAREQLERDAEARIEAIRVWAATRRERDAGR